MRLGLVNAAIGAAARLDIDHAPARLFIAMAAVPLDEDPKPTYWRGREVMASVFGKQGDAGARAVNRALKSLVDSRLVKQTAAPAPGARFARYALLNGAGAPLQPLRVIHNVGRSASHDSTARDGQRPTNAGRSASERGTLSVQTRDGERPAEQEEQEEQEGARASTPTRTCTRHSNWDHGEACRACGLDRRTSEAHDATRRPRTMSEAPSPCARGAHRFDADSGYCYQCGIRDDQVSDLPSNVRHLREAS